MANLLNKLDNIEIKNTTRIDDDDKIFCEEKQEQYSKAMQCLKNIYQTINEQLGIDFSDSKGFSKTSTNKYLNWYSFKDIDKLPIEKTELFINHIINYFSTKYKVKLKEQFPADVFIQKNYDYNNIIDYIYEQLDGLDFTERGKQDTIANTKGIYWYNEYQKRSNITLNKSKITIDGYFAKKHWYHNYSILNDNYSHIFKSLYLFDKGFVQKETNELQLRYCGYKNEEREDAFDKYEPTTFTKLKSIKFFKNGKMELVFTTEQYAKEFAYEYLGYEDNEVK